MAYVSAPNSVQATSVAFYPVFGPAVVIQAQATDGPNPASTTITLTVAAPTVTAAPTFMPHLWAVNADFAYASPQPNSRPVIHLGGYSNAIDANGFVSNFNVTNTATTIPGSYAIIQLILECARVIDMTTRDGSTTFIGTKGPSGTIDTLDGRIAAGPDVPVSVQPSFAYYFPDSPGLALGIDNLTDQGSAYDSETFRTIAMYKFNIDSDPASPNIWVPLNQALSWTWEGTASYNILDQSNTWEASNSPSPATYFALPILSEPTWSYDFPFYGFEKQEIVSSCQ
jgi:hypothetical protein